MSNQNRSSAVMNQRAADFEGLDHYPTPAYSCRAAIEHFFDAVRPRTTALDPCCGEGYMAETFRERGFDVHATDVADYGGYGDGVADFLDPSYQVPWAHLGGPELVFANPPFKLALEFALKALDIVRPGGQVMFMERTNWLEGVKRYNDLFSVHPPSKIAIFTERVALVKGRMDLSASTATSYSWVMWDKNHEGPTLFEWIKPGAKKRLVRDYDALLPKDWPRA